MCRNKLIDFNKIPKKIKKDNSDCVLKDKKIKCNEKHPNKFLCLFHNSIFEIWNVCGGYKILDDDLLTGKEKYETFLKDLESIDFLNHDSQFTDEVIGMIESYFETKFNKKI